MGLRIEPLAIEKQLNKIESAHRFARAISVGNPREFTQAEKHEQEIAEGCKRLIKNAIIGCNYLYLSQKIDEEKDPQHQQSLLQAIASGSIVSWQHINLLGEYDFSEEKLQDTVGNQAPQNPCLKHSLILGGKKGKQLPYLKIG